LASLHPSTEVIGVISVYNRDALWSFSQRDAELLMLHADRVALAMQAADLARQSQSQVDLLGMLASDPQGSQPHTLYQRVRDTVRRMIDAPSFALLHVLPSGELIYELAERDGLAVANGPFPAAPPLPPWWESVRAGRPFCISAPEDHALHPDYCTLGWGGDQPVQSILAAPLVSGPKQLLGAIVAGSPRPDSYPPEHVRLFSAMARSAAILMQNARLSSESSQYRARTYEKEEKLARLNEAVLSLSATLDLEKTLEALVLRARELTAARVCTVFLKEGDFLVGQVASTQADNKTIERLENVHVSLGWRSIGAALDSDQHAVPLDHLESEWDDDTETGRLLAQGRMRSCLVLPITHEESSKEVPKESAHGKMRGKTLGALVVYTPGERHHFSPEEVSLLRALASQAGGAISNARLYHELQEAYKAQQELDRLKEDFILQVSHEFRTPVTTIDGYVDLIRRHGTRLEQAKLDQYAGEIRASTGQLMSMVNRLHEASSIDTQPLTISKARVNLRAAAEEAITNQGPEATGRSDNQVPTDLWVLGDAARLTPVLSNLLSNALKYSPAPQTCLITAHTETRATLVQQGRSHATEQGAAERWVVAGVRDFGEGIPFAEQDKLFQKFVRLPRSLTTSVRGTGLGLWICRQYVQAMGGDIWVESEPGKGTHFQFCLPLASAPDAT
jgi:signal transduction histidine kinase